MNRHARAGAAAIFCIQLFFSSMAVADNPPTVEILSSYTRTFDNGAGCRRRHDCDLTKFLLKVDTYRVHLPHGQISYGTRSFARYETKEVGQLEEFGLAQFLKGCQYSSSWDGNSVKKTRDIEIDIDGKFVDYHFRKWIIDGFVSDPIDWGDVPDSPSRHFFYKWNRVPGSMEKETSQWFGLERPTNAALYVVDHPGTAFYNSDSRTARNISVNFKTCLYRTSDVPKDVDPADVRFAKPIRCFDWNSSFIYDFRAAAMTSPARVDPFCRNR